MIDIEGYLSSKGSVVKKNHSQVYTHCFFCGEDPSKPGRLYINNTGSDRHGLFKCFLCDRSGAFRQIQEHFGDSPDLGFSDLSRQIIHKAARLYNQNLRPEDRLWLNEARGLSDSTIDSRGLGYAPGGVWLYSQLKGLYDESDLLASGLIRRYDNSIRDTFGQGITIPYFAGSSCVLLRLRSLTGEGPKYLSAGGSETRLFNVNSTWKTDDLVICEGEFDTMVMEQLGFSAVGIPGAQNWPPSWNSYVEDAKRVWIICDPDDAGISGAERIETALGAKAKITHLPVPAGADPGQVDPTYLVVEQGWTVENFKELFDSTVRRNSLLIKPSTAFESWVDDERVGGLKTGWEEFDRVVGKGFRRSDLIVPIARTNTGKSLMLINLLQSMSTVPGQEDLKLFFITLEQTAAQWFDRARKIWNFYNLDCEPEKVNQEAAAFWEPRLRLVEKNRLNEEEILGSLDDYRADMGDYPDLIALDYLGYLSRGYPGSQTIDRVSAAAQSLKGIAKEINRPIVAPSQASRKAEHGSEVGLDDARDSGEIENTADIAIALWSQDTMKGKSSGDRTGELMAKLVKTRGPGRGKSVKFFFAPLSLAWVPEHGPDSNRRVPMVKNEIVWDTAGDVDWTEAIMAHRGIQPTRRSF